MKVSKISSGLLLGLMLLLATTASAATNSSKNKGSVNIQHPLRLMAQDWRWATISSRGREQVPTSN